ncbi:MAG: YncE family protein, partial [Anaerolineae bacterium]|nr:YncE family protein [Anaerolineae bacterium]
MIRPFRLVWLALCLFLLATGLVSVAQSPAYPLPIGSPVQVSGSLLELASQRLLVANPDSDTVSIVQPSGGTIDSEIAVGTEPRSVALAPDGVQAVIVNRGDGTLSVVDLLEGTLTATYSVGELPYAALVYGSSIVVTIQSEPSVILLDLKTGERQAEIRVPADPAAMAIWGRYLYVTHYWSGELTLIDLDAAEVLATLSLGPDIAHSASIAIDRRNGLAYLPQTIPNWQMTAAAPEARMLPVINVVDLSEMRLLPERQIFLPAADRMVNMPSAALIDRGRNSLYVTQAGSAALSIIDLDTGYVVAHVETGIAPMDVILSRNALSIYVHDRIDQTITEFDAVYRSYVDTM